MQIEWFLVHMFNIPVVPICIPGLQKTFPGEHLIVSYNGFHLGCEIYFFQTALNISAGLCA